MPSRILREDLLTSERYWSCSPEARNLFVAIVLSADDTARCQGSSFYLRTHCMAGTVNSERIEKLLTELHDVDLVRIYSHDNTRYLFVPRFRQRLRYTHSKYPEPPLGINDLVIEKTDLSQTHVSPESARREEKRSRSRSNTSSTPLVPCAPAPETSDSVTTVLEKTVIKIPLIGNKEFDVPESYVAEMDALYPAVDVLQTLREIRAWNLSNPQKRKTQSGIKTHINRWLAKEQNHG